jgi:hypothetical protein
MRFIGALSISIVLTLVTAGYVSAISDVYFQCTSMPDGIPKLKYCLANLSRLEPDERSDVYKDISDIYFKFGNIDKGIAFGTMAAKAADSLINSISNAPADRLGISYKEIQRRYTSRLYESLARKENIASLQLDIKRDLNGAATYATQPLLHATRAILLWSSNHEAYALSAEINAQFCKSSEAENDLRRAIDLAVRAHNTTAAEYYRNIISSNHCQEDHRGRLD